MKNQVKTLLLLGVIALVLSFMPGCGGDDDPVTPPGNQDPPTFSLGTDEQIDLPEGLINSADPMANMVASYMQVANSFSAYTGFFTPPSKAAATDGPPWVYTWTVTQLPDLDLAFVLTVDETSTAYTWRYVVNGFDEDGTYDNAVFYEAELAKDGSMGHLAIYDVSSSTTVPVLSWDWATSSIGVFTMELMSYEEGGIRLVWEVMPDGSGTLDYYEMFEAAWRITYHFDWTATGSGSWILYNYEGGANTSGTWSAATPALKG